MWVARDDNKILWLYINKPRRSKIGKWWDVSPQDCDCLRLNGELFPKLRWKDEPIEVELAIGGEPIRVEYHKGEWVKDKDGRILQVDKYTSDSGYKPIDLTAELLEINDFKPRGDNHFTYSYEYGYYIEIVNCYCGSSNEVTVNLKAGDYRDFMTELRIKVRYVHELQHALRLCEIGKEIKIC